MPEQSMGMGQTSFRIEAAAPSNMESADLKPLSGWASGEPW